MPAAIPLKDDAPVVVLAIVVVAVVVVVVTMAVVGAAVVICAADIWDGQLVSKTNHI